MASTETCDLFFAADETAFFVVLFGEADLVFFDGVEAFVFLGKEPEPFDVDLEETFFDAFGLAAFLDVFLDNPFDTLPFFIDGLTLAEVLPDFD